MSAVHLRNLCKTFDGVEVVRQINLEIGSGEFIVLVGPSGCGKSTTLRMIAGLEEITSGQIVIGDRVVNDLAPKNRDIAMVFQNYALYPHMSSAENMGFGLKMRGLHRDDISAEVGSAAGVLGIEGLLARIPRQLSGGQRQRVAMGRAIVRKPKVFLFDEPLSNLDAKLRAQMRLEMKRLHRTLRTTTVYVTHDQTEAMTLAERIVVMNGGIIEQVGTPAELYANPRTRFVAGFIGSPSMSFLPGRLVASSSGPLVELPGGHRIQPSQALATRLSAHRDQDVVIGVRPEHVRLVIDDLDEAEGIDVQLDLIEPLGAESYVYFSIRGHPLCARVPGDERREPGQPAKVILQSDRLHVIDPVTDRVL